VTPRVELIYDADCPNLEAARAALLRGMAEAGLPPAWTEWDRRAPASPPHARHYGSPTILVGGRDVAGAESGPGADACRVYEHELRGLSGVPPVEWIAAALRATGLPASSRAGRSWLRPLAALPGVGAALLPVGLCPACWPAYAAVLAAVGLGFLLEAEYLLPITAGLLALALVALGFRASNRRGYRPLALGFASAAAILAFKFFYPIGPLAYVGLLGLVAASVWNSWPKRNPGAGSCPSCAREESAPQRRGRPEETAT